MEPIGLDNITSEIVTQSRENNQTVQRPQLALPQHVFEELRAKARIKGAENMAGKADKADKADTSSHAAVAAAAEVALKKFQREHTITIDGAILKALRKNLAAIQKLRDEQTGILKVVLASADKEELQVNWSLSEDGTQLIPTPPALPGQLPPTS